eukprot:c19073_g1_i2 orf=542-3265(-)
MPSYSNPSITIMDHLAVQCKKKLETFRIKELKEVLSRINAGKQGKKQVLVDRIMAIILSPEMALFNPMGLKLESMSSRHSKSREDVAKVIDDVYRMRYFGAPDLATRVESRNENGIGVAPVSFFGLARQSKVNDVLNAAGSKAHCPCGNTMELGTMIQCKAPSCLVWQHVNCVIVPEKENMKPEIPTNFLCEICRIQHGDPFCVSYSHPLKPSKTITSIVCTAEGGSSMLQSLDATFTLTQHERELLCNPVYDLQIWCVLLGDEVAFRMHWPLKAELRVNGEFVRVTCRPGQQKLGLNGRDDGPVITDLTKDSVNSISFTAQDGRSFCLGVRIIERLTVDQVMSRIPSEAQGEIFDMALSRVRRCIGGGGAVDGDGDSDSDLEVVSEWVTVNLRCPVSGSRMKIAGRFKPCLHMGCFDLHTFVELNQRARKWQCPICSKNYSLKDLIIDPFFTQITRALKSYDEDVSEIEMKPDGCWRPKLDGDAKFNESWRSPIGLISLTNGVNNSQEVFNSVKVEEGVSVERVPLKIGFKRTQDGLWKVNGTLGFADLTMNAMLLGHNYQGIHNGARSQSSTATASNEVSSVNQDPLKFLNHFALEEVEVDSFPVNAPVNTFPSGLGGDLDLMTKPDIIEVSDTEESNLDTYNFGAEALGSLHTDTGEVQENDEACLVDFERGFIHGISETAVSFPDVGPFQQQPTEAMDFLGTGRGTLTSPSVQEDIWEPDSHVGPLDFFSSAMEASAVGQSSHLPNQHSRETNMLEISYTNRNGESQSSGGQVYQNLGTEGPMRFAASDASLRDFLPHQPAKSAANFTGHELLKPLSDGMKDGCFLSLGGRESLTNAVSPVCEVANQRKQVDPLVESAVLLELSNHETRVDGSTLTSKRTKGSTITQPAQYQKNYFCIDSDSD